MTANALQGSKLQSDQKVAQSTAGVTTAISTNTAIPNLQKAVGETPSCSINIISCSRRQDLILNFAILQGLKHRFLIEYSIESDFVLPFERDFVLPFEQRPFVALLLVITRSSPIK
jgi:hypothetical protein